MDNYKWEMEMEAGTEEILGLNTMYTFLSLAICVLFYLFYQDLPKTKYSYVCMAARLVFNC